MNYTINYTIFINTFNIILNENLVYVRPTYEQNMYYYFDKYKSFSEFIYAYLGKNILNDLLKFKDYTHIEINCRDKGLWYGTNKAIYDEKEIDFLKYILFTRIFQSTRF